MMAKQNQLQLVADCKLALNFAFQVWTQCLQQPAGDLTNLRHPDIKFSSAQPAADWLQETAANYVLYALSVCLTSLCL